MADLIFFSRCNTVFVRINEILATFNILRLCDLLLVRRAKALLDKVKTMCL